MKTREEIENIIPNTGYGLSYNYDDGFIDGYIRCQEDMTKDVEYWEGEFEHWYKQAMDMSNKYNELLIKQDSEQNEQLCEFIYVKNVMKSYLKNLKNHKLNK